MRIAAVLLLLFGLCSCSFDQRPAQIRCEPVTQMSCVADCTQGENTFSFSVRTQERSIEIGVLQPENLHGVSFASDSPDSITTDANGLTDVFHVDAFAQSSPIRLLTQGIRTFLFSGTETLTSMADGTFTSQQLIGNVTAIGVFSQNGQLLQLQYPTLETVFVFSYTE